MSEQEEGKAGSSGSEEDNKDPEGPNRSVVGFVVYEPKNKENFHGRICQPRGRILQPEEGP